MKLKNIISFYTTSSVLLVSLIMFSEKAWFGSKSAAVFCIGLFGILYCIYYTIQNRQINFPVYTVKYVEHKRHKDQNYTHRILIWTENSENDKWGLFGRTINSNFFNECPFKNCIITENRTYMEHYKFDAVFFDAVEFHERMQLPKTRSPHQVYLFGITEPPIKRLTQIENLIFNYTCKLIRIQGIHHIL